jgi:hypothetical protein
MHNVQKHNICIKHQAGPEWTKKFVAFTFLCFYKGLTILAQQLALTIIRLYEYEYIRLSCFILYFCCEWDPELRGFLSVYNSVVRLQIDLKKKHMSRRTAGGMDVKFA